MVSLYVGSSYGPLMACQTDMAVIDRLISNRRKTNYFASTVEPLTIVSSCREANMRVNVQAVHRNKRVAVVEKWPLYRG